MSTMVRTTSTTAKGRTGFDSGLLMRALLRRVLDAFSFMSRHDHSRVRGRREDVMGGAFLTQCGIRSILLRPGWSR